jgi:mutator family transposase
VLAVGDGALGFWGALREVLPQTREQRCWFHRSASILAAIPKSAHPAAKKALAEIWGAEDKTHALAAVKAFAEQFGARFPKAVAKITDDVEELLAFYDYPAGHWIHLRTTNPIESTFSTVRHRTKITRGPGSRAAGLAMAFKLDAATALRRALPMAAHWLAGDAGLPVPPGSLGGAAALERLAELVETGLEPWQHAHLGYFAIRVGARRLADAAVCLAYIGENKAAGLADEQARLVGALQHPLVTGDRATVARLLRRLAPTYDQLRASLPGG